MYVYTNGMFLMVQLHDGGWGQNAFSAGYGASSWQAQVHDRQVMIQVGQDALQLAQQQGQGPDVHVVAARHAADGYYSGQAVPVDAVRMQNLWNQAQRPELERTAARTLYLMLAGRHRQVQLDVASVAASLFRSTWEVLSAAALLHSYGALRFGNGQVPNPADLSGWQSQVTIALGSEPPDLSRLGPFADALYRTNEAIGPV